MRRYLWAGTRAKRLHGVCRPADDAPNLGWLGRGTIYELEPWSWLEIPSAS